MGLIGSHFLTHLVTPPELWPEHEVPVFVIPDTVQLSDVHNVRLTELGLGIGIPFQITQQSPNDRPVAKIVESQAIRSIVTIVEDSVELREIILPTTTVTGGSSKLSLHFTYSALDDFELKVDVYVKMHPQMQKISPERVAIPFDTMIVPAGMNAQFSSQEREMKIDAKYLPGIAHRQKKSRNAIFDIILTASTVSPSTHPSSPLKKVNSVLNAESSSIASESEKVPNLPLGIQEPSESLTNAEHLVIVGKQRMNWTNAWAAIPALAKKPSFSSALMRSKPSTNSLLSAALDNHKLIWLKEVGYSHMSIVKEAYFFRVNVVSADNYLMNRKIAKEIKNKRAGRRASKMSNDPNDQLVIAGNTSSHDEQSDNPNHHIPTSKPMKTIEVKASNSPTKSNKKKKKAKKQRSGFSLLSRHEDEEEEGDSDDSDDMHILSDDSDVENAKKDIDTMIANFEQQKEVVESKPPQLQRTGNSDNSISNVEMRNGSEVDQSPVPLVHSSPSQQRRKSQLQKRRQSNADGSSSGGRKNSVAKPVVIPSIIKLDLIYHKYEMNKGVYDAMAIYGAESKTQELKDLYLKHTAEQGADKKASPPPPAKDENDNMCVVCLSSEKEVVLYPCRHCNMCIDCAKMISDQGRKCPVCRQLVTLLIHLH